MIVLFYFVASVIVCLNAISLDNSFRITGGVVASDQFPYAISVQQIVNQNQTTRGHMCGGVLITLNHALTSASCFYNGPSTPNLNVSQYRVFAGATRLTDDSQNFVRNVHDIIIHPEYNTTTYLNDIAVLNLTNPFLNSSMVLPLPPNNDIVPDSSECTVAGWGANRVQAGVNASEILLYGTKFTYNQDLCVSFYANYDAMLNSSSQICASSFLTPSSGCIGDFGNALVCKNTLTGLWSFANHVLCNPNFIGPEIYTRVSTYNTWVRTITASASTSTPGILIFIAIACTQLFTLSK